MGFCLLFLFFSVSILLSSMSMSWSTISPQHYHFNRLATWRWWCGTDGRSSRGGTEDSQSHHLMLFLVFLLFLLIIIIISIMHVIYTFHIHFLYFSYIFIIIYNLHFYESNFSEFCMWKTFRVWDRERGENTDKQKDDLCWSTLSPLCLI